MASFRREKTKWLKPAPIESGLVMSIELSFFRYFFLMLIARFPFVDWAMLISGFTFDEFFLKRYN